MRRINEFLGFGKLLQNLLDELYKARAATAEQQLMRWYDGKFANLSVEEPDAWWQECGRLMAELVELPEIASAALYIRRGSRYELKAQAPASRRTNACDSTQSPARDADLHSRKRTSRRLQMDLAGAPPRVHTRDAIVAVLSGELRSVSDTGIPALPTPADNDGQAPGPSVWIWAGARM